MSTGPAKASEVASVSRTQPAEQSAPFARPRAPAFDLVGGAKEPPTDDCPATVRTPRHPPTYADERSGDGAERGAPAAEAVAIHRVVPIEAAPDTLEVTGDEAGFFRFDSFPPVVEDLEELEPESVEPPPSPELLARRAGLRRAVGAVVASVAVLALVAVVLGALRGGSEADAVVASAPGGDSPPAAALTQAD
ncbi:MAG: hypothetical protein JRI23_29060, partial [Deltaproteobacteria bacterium]|nr:hypothetical protein [Deltaproteobacteria bacterium]MBW2536181.1 hypothetical protein [Deltaproteobacteria bacterium]